MIDETSSGSSSAPVTPSRTSDAAPALLLTATGLPHASASATARPNPSRSEASVQTCAARSQRATSSAGTSPASVNAPEMPSASARAAISSRSGPSPTSASAAPRLRAPQLGEGFEQAQRILDLDEVADLAEPRARRIPGERRRRDLAVARTEARQVDAGRR